MTRRDVLRLSAASTLTAGLRPPLALADESPKPKSPDEMIDAYLAAEVKRIVPRFMDGVKTKAEWEAARPRLKREFLDMLGLDPLPEKTPLTAGVTNTLERSGVTIQNIHFQSRPGLYVTGNLYLPLPKPNRKDAKHPGILYVCGHAGRGRDGNKTAYHDHGLWFGANGYVCLVVDTLQLGEVEGKHHGTYNLGRWWWHDLGYTPAGVECWNGIRAIDYLISRPEVDAEKIGVTGISGGGATTCWVASADDRVKVAVPVSGMSDLECYVIDKVVNGHCDCMFPVNTYQWELTTILALFAPKPLLFANSDDDGIFPMSGNRRIAKRMRECYDLLGAKDKFDDYVSKGGHAYRADLRLAIFGFFHKHLLGSDAAIKDADFPKIEGKDLRVYPTDADLPKDSINAKADETFVPTAKVKLPTDAKEFATWKAGLVKQLREKCFRAMPEKVPAVKEIEVSPAGTAFMCAEEGVSFFSCILGRDAKGERSTLVLFNPEDAIKNAEALQKRYAKDLYCFGYFPRGSEFSSWTRKNPPNTVERSLALVGQTADSGRVRDMAAVLQLWATAKDKPGLVGITGPAGPIRIAGRGQAGIVAAYAALFVPGVAQEIELIDPPTSHRDGPHFLNVLRVLDIPEALGLLAPNLAITLIGKNAKDKAFDRTEAIYKAAGVADKFKRE